MIPGACTDKKPDLRSRRNIFCIGGGLLLYHIPTDLVTVRIFRRSHLQSGVLQFDFRIPLRQIHHIRYRHLFHTITDDNLHRAVRLDRLTFRRILKQDLAFWYRVTVFPLYNFHDKAFAFQHLIGCLLIISHHAGHHGILTGKFPKVDAPQQKKQNKKGNEYHTNNYPVSNPAVLFPGVLLFRFRRRIPLGFPFRLFLRISRIVNGRKNPRRLIVFHKTLYILAVRLFQCPFQIGAHLIRIIISSVAVLLDRSFYDKLNAFGDIRIHLTRRRYLLLYMLQGNRNGTVSLKGDRSGYHFIQNNPQRVNIGFFVHMTSPCLLRGKIMHGTDYIRTGHGNGSRGNSPGNAKICDLHCPVFAQQDILGLDVPVNNIAAVCVMQCRANLRTDPDRIFSGQPALFTDILLQGFPVDIFHYDVMDPVLLSNIIDIYDIGMGETGS